MIKIFYAILCLFLLTMTWDRGNVISAILSAGHIFVGLQLLPMNSLTFSFFFRYSRADKDDSIAICYHTSGREERCWDRKKVAEEESVSTERL